MTFVFSTALISGVKIHCQGQSLKSFLPLHLEEEWPGSRERLGQGRRWTRSSTSRPAKPTLLRLLLIHTICEPSSWVREHCLAKATPDTGHSTQDWHRLNLDQSHQKVQIAIHHPKLQKVSQLIEIKKKRVDKNIIIFSALKINLATWTASTVSFQEDFAAELIFSPFMGAALARRLTTPSPGPT